MTRFRLVLPIPTLLKRRHQVNALPYQAGESLLRPARVTPEAQNLDIGRRRTVQVGDIEFRNQQCRA